MYTLYSLRLAALVNMQVSENILVVYPRRHVMRALSVRGRKGSGSHVWIATMLLVINTNETISFTSHIAMQLPAVDSCFDCSSETITFELSVSVDCIAMFLLWRHRAQKNIFSPI